MNIQIILLVLGLTPIFANNMSNYEYYYPHEDNAELMFKNLFLKLNTIVKNVADINKRLDIDEIKCQNRGEWTVIQRRQDGSVDFNRTWEEYKQGFGCPNGEFFIGLEKLHALTAKGPTQELWITLKDFEGKTGYAIYDKFVIGSEAEMYSLKELGSYRGNAGDNLSYHKSRRFSTADTGNCGIRFGGGWWFKNGIVERCYSSNLNGPYLKGINPTGGTSWGGFHAWNYSLKFVEILIRSAPSKN